MYSMKEIENLKMEAMKRCRERLDKSKKKSGESDVSEFGVTSVLRMKHGL